MSNLEQCPSCQKFPVKHMKGESINGQTTACNENGNKVDVYFLRKVCPECDIVIISLYFRYPTGRFENKGRVFPVGKYNPAPPEIPASFAKDYNEAMNIFDLSSNASTALLRRCLENVLKNKIGIKEGKLAKKVETYLKMTEAHPIIKKYIDTARKAGNISSHVFSDISDQIIDNTPEEVEFTKKVIDMMFQHHFIEEEELARISKQIEEKSPEK